MVVDRTERTMGPTRAGGGRRREKWISGGGEALNSRRGFRIDGLWQSVRALLDGFA